MAKKKYINKFAIMETAKRQANQILKKADELVITTDELLEFIKEYIEYSKTK